MLRQFICILFISGLLLSCNEQNSRDRDNEAGREEAADSLSMADWQHYKNSELGLSLRYPTDWVLTEDREQPDNVVVINIHKRNIAKNPEEQPFHLHESAEISYLAIWPKGIGTEFPSGDQKNYTEIATPHYTFPLNTERSKVFYLENGEQWAAFLSPATGATNTNWDEYGFVFAQAAIAGFSAECTDKDTGANKPMRQCDPLAGDRVIKKGSVDQADWQLLTQIISSMEFTQTEERPLSDLIRVERPQPNMNIQSPLSIQGTARGYWYFEGNFPISLKDAAGKVIARGYATAQGEWMTEDFVPFEASLEYNTNKAPDDERGQLVFERANPSGLAKNDRSYAIPVLFPPKQ